MDKIKLNDIDLSSLKQTEFQGTKSTVYEDGDKCIKILNGLYPKEKRLLHNKFLEMDGMTINGVLLPTSLIIQDNVLEGYIMDNFKNSATLYDFFASQRYINCKELFEALKKASKILKDIHNNGIIYQDLSFENILINKSGNVMYCDVDACSYKNHTSFFISKLLFQFLFDYRHEVELNFRPSKNSDKLSMILSLLNLLYLQEVQNLSRWEYHSLSRHISTIKNLKPYVRELLNLENEIPELPYLDEVINDGDNYDIDRSKQILRLIKKISRKG